MYHVTLYFTSIHMPADVKIHIIIFILCYSIKPFPEIICVTGIDIFHLNEWEPATESWGIEKSICIFQYSLSSPSFRAEQLQIEYMVPQELFHRNCSTAAVLNQIHFIAYLCLNQKRSMINTLVCSIIN